MIRLAMLLGLLLAGPALAAQPPVTVQHLRIDITVRPDGSSTLTEHREQSAATITAAARLARLPIAVNTARQRLEILEAYTRKVAGTRIPADPALRAELAPRVPDVPAFRDAQQRIVAFPDLGVGDTAVITLREDSDRPLLPGQFFWEADFIPTIAWEDVAVSITAPAGYKLHTESFGMEFTRSEQDGTVRYLWHYRQPDAVAEDMATVSPWDRVPRLFVSSLPDYAALGAAYAALAAPKIRTSPLLAARANAVTSGIADRRAQAKAIYEWVSQHVRNIPVDLRISGMEPHDALAVMVNGYGDSKDQAVLLAALLRAKRIDSQPVLINLGTAYTLSGPPTLAQLDHVILYLPEFDLYADTTPGVAPFGTLLFQAYGKPAVVSDGDSAALRRMPVLPPDAASISATTVAHMDLDGAIIGTSSVTATGPAAIALRLIAGTFQTDGGDRWVRRALAGLGEQGTGGFTFGPTGDFADSFTAGGQFRLDPRPGLLESDRFTPPVGLQLLVRPGDFFLGPLDRPGLPAAAPTPCYAGRQVEDISLQLPEGRAPRRLPRDVAVDTPAFGYSARWTMQGQTLHVHRELVSRITTALCGGALRREAMGAQAVIRREQQETVALGGM